MRLKLSHGHLLLLPCLSNSPSFPLGLTTFGSDWHHTTARCCPWGPLRSSLYPEQSQRDILVSFISGWQEVVRSLASTFQKPELWLTVAQTASCQALMGGVGGAWAPSVHFKHEPHHPRPGGVQKLLRAAEHDATIQKLLSTYIQVESSEGLLIELHLFLNTFREGKKVSGMKGDRQWSSVWLVASVSYSSS